MLKPALGEKLNGRSAHEMETLSEALDYLLIGQLAKGMSILMQRFKSLEVAAQGGNFDRGRHLELVRPNQITCVSDRELDLARQNALTGKRLTSYRG